MPSESSQAESFFILHSHFNLTHHYYIAYSTFYYLFLLTLLYCCSSVVSLHDWAPYHFAEKTKVHFPGSPLHTPDFTPTENVDIQFSYPSSLERIFSLKNKTHGNSHDLQNNYCPYRKCSGVQPSTELSLPSKLAIDMSLPIKYSIMHTSEPSTSFLTTSEHDSLEENNFQPYKTQIFSSGSDCREQQTSKLSSFPYTSNTRIEPAPTDISRLGITEIWKDERDADFTKSEMLENRFVSTKYEENYSIVCGRPCIQQGFSGQNMRPANYSRSSSNGLCRKNWNIFYLFAYCPGRVCCGNDSVFDENINTKYLEPNQEKDTILNVEKKHFFEFETSYIRSNPHLLTNVKSEYKAYCRLCKTKSHQTIDGLEQTLTIIPTTSNLNFPEPETKDFRRIKNCHTCTREVKSGEEISSSKSFVCDNPAPSIAKTLPPDIFPEPSTKYSLKATEVPYTYSYEVTIEDSLYHSQAWTGKEVFPGSFPVSLSKQSALCSELGTCGIHNPLHLESSIRSFPEVRTRSTEMPNIMLTNF